MCHLALFHILLSLPVIYCSASWNSLSPSLMLCLYQVLSSGHMWFLYICLCLLPDLTVSCFLFLCWCMLLFQELIGLLFLFVLHHQGFLLSLLCLDWCCPISCILYLHIPDCLLTHLLLPVLLCMDAFCLSLCILLCRLLCHHLTSAGIPDMCSLCMDCLLSDARILILYPIC